MRHDRSNQFRGPPLIAQRPIWRGQLRLALVSCPVALYTARHDRETVRFNMINPATGNRIKMVSQDAKTSEPISRGDTVRGYEFKKDQYLIFTDEELDRVKVESSSLMVVEKFVESASIDPIYYDASYFLAPDGKESEDVYAVLREAIHRTGKIALTRIVIGQRERTVAVRLMGDGLVAHTLNEERDLNSGKQLFEGVANVGVDPEMVQLAVQHVERQTGRYEPADLEDRYETRLRAIVDARIKGEAEIAPDEQVSTHGNVIDLMAALKRSLTQATAAEADTSSGKSATASVPASATARDIQPAKPGTARGKKAPTPEEVRRQPTFKLPIEGGRKAAGNVEVQSEPEATARPRRKAS